MNFLLPLVPEDYNYTIIQSCYFLSSFLFLLALGGLSHQESARRGNIYGMFGMALAVCVTFLTDGFYDLDFGKFFIGFIGGGIVGMLLAVRVLYFLSFSLEFSLFYLIRFK